MTSSAAIYERSLCWIRRDLRLKDNKALSEACRKSQEVAVVFVFDEQILQHLPKKDARLAFIQESLGDLHETLQAKGSSLIILTGDPVEKIPKLAKELLVQAVFTNEDYENYAKKRDQKVQKALEKEDRRFHSFKDQVIFSGSEVLKEDGTPYRVFTPYKNAWLKKLTEDKLQDWKVDLSKLMPAARMKKQKHPSLSDLGFEQISSPVLAGTKGAAEALQKFLEHINGYKEERDFPAVEGTSRLSVHLRFGTISIRECVRQCWKDRSAGGQTWLSELIWRDFYEMILDRYPHVEKHAFQEKYDSLKWPNDKALFQKWCEGKTGFPIVDAAMRQLNETGWMHNRLRMITASFLVKDLLVDWRWGEKYFAEKLLDFDLAANNGGWQWCASTGCDAQPYFRIFNPHSQSLKFDPEGKFILRYVPELKGLTLKKIHQPGEEGRAKGYPLPIVDHDQQRRKTLLLYKSAATIKS